MIPLTLDWGELTSDGYDSNINEALFIYNFDFKANDRARVINFVVARSVWANLNLPKNCSQKIIFDIRGQNLNSNIVNEFYQNILALLKAEVKNTVILEMIKQ